MSAPPEESRVASKVADAAILGGILIIEVGVFWAPHVVGISVEQMDRVTRVSVGILGLLAGTMWLLLRMTRRDLRRIEGMLTDVLFGAGTKRDREAIDILVRALRAPDAGARDSSLRMLRKISGLELGEDPTAWEEWWTVARSTFTRPGPQSAKK